MLNEIENQPLLLFSRAQDRLIRIQHFIFSLLNLIP